MNYQKIMQDLEKYKNTHPNLSTFWKFYIELKKKSFEKSLKDCSKIIDNFEHINDVNLINLWFIYL